MMCVPRVLHIPHTPRRTERVPDARPLSAVRGPRFTVHGWCHPPILADLQASGVRSPLARAFPSFTLHSFIPSLLQPFTVHFQLSACAYQCWLLGRLWVPLGISRGRRAVDGFFFPFMSTVHPPHVPLISPPDPQPSSCSTCSERAPRLTHTRTLSHLHFTPIPFKLKLSGYLQNAVRSSLPRPLTASCRFSVLTLFPTTRQVLFPYPYHPPCPPHSQVTARTSCCVL